MKKFALYAYIVLTLSILMTAVSWLTWDNSCSYVYLIPEGSSFGGMCGGDGLQFAGLFGIFVVVSALFLLLSALVLKVLGFKIVKKER